MAKAFIGFKFKDNYKLMDISDENVKIEPEFLGNVFLSKMTTGVGYISNQKNSIIFFHHIYLVDENGSDTTGFKNSYYLQQRNENYEKAKEGDFKWIYVPYFSRGRVTRYLIWPDKTKEVLDNISDYEWGYIFNAEKIAVEFYGRSFKTPVDEKMGIPYFASINIHSACVFMNLQKKFNMIPLLYRNNEQEFVLQDSLKIPKKTRSKK